MGLDERKKRVDLLRDVADSGAAPAGAHLLRIDDMGKCGRIARHGRDEVPRLIGAGPHRVKK